MAVEREPFHDEVGIAIGIINLCGGLGNILLSLHDRGQQRGERKRNVLRVRRSRQHRSRNDA